eukprot:CAMPEP_0176449170 /NCGR_PEP_ID=MMETSP0127-20121128/26281_1 /TAXON_ID=938130 /ORGANISM="Platyophrya macrostoma, Strain WH" /LENGTH=82 /DNA_ID=CAMNT_0017836383 /DNA_START=36 /DNA_END=280 /DNA_ORIENTATION=+
MPDSRILLVSGFRKRLGEGEVLTSALYKMFGTFGPIRQVRVGSSIETRGKAIVIFEYSDSAEAALLKLNQFNLGGTSVLRIS